MKEQEKTPGKTTNETETDKLSDKEFKALLVIIVIGLGKIIDKHS